MCAWPRAWYATTIRFAPPKGRMEGDVLRISSAFFILSIIKNLKHGLHLFLWVYFGSFWDVIILSVMTTKLSGDCHNQTILNIDLIFDYQINYSGNKSKREGFSLNLFPSQHLGDAHDVLIKQIEVAQESIH